MHHDDWQRTSALAHKVLPIFSIRKDLLTAFSHLIRSVERETHLKGAGHWTSWTGTENPCFSCFPGSAT